jgi:hypothetical protein
MQAHPDLHMQPQAIDTNMTKVVNILPSQPQQQHSTSAPVTRLAENEVVMPVGGQPSQPLQHAGDGGSSSGSSSGYSSDSGNSSSYGSSANESAAFNIPELPSSSASSAVSGGSRRSRGSRRSSRSVQKKEGNPPPLSSVSGDDNSTLTTEEEDDDDMVSVKTDEILRTDPLYFVLSKIFVTQDGKKNVADLLSEVVELLKSKQSRS